MVGGQRSLYLHVYMMIRVKLAPPTLGVWSMAGLLGQPLEYYYYKDYTSNPIPTSFLYLKSFCRLCYEITGKSIF